MKDPYEWSRQRITKIVEKINPIKNDGLVPSYGQVWSIKKLLALDYYISATHVIYKKYFDNWYYVDTHCGSGLIGFEENMLKDEKFAGSPFIATLNNEKKPFSDYFLSDINQESIDALKQRMSVLKPSLGNKTYNPICRSFEDTVKEIQKYVRVGNMFLIFVDPKGYKDIKWTLIRELLSINKADIFITLMSYSLPLNIPHAKPNTKAEKNFNELFGNEEWKNANNQQELVEIYLNQIRKYKKYVYTIPVYKTRQDKLYDLIFATNNGGAKNIIDDTKGILDVVTTELIESALKVATNKKKDLSEWF